MAGKIGRRPKKYSQAERLARMMRVLASRGVTVNELAEDMNITRRQVHRDLARIAEEGHPLDSDDDEEIADRESLEFLRQTQTACVFERTF